jgi:hypothetical protein
VWVAGELLISQPVPVSKITRTLFAAAQLALIVASQKCAYTSDPYLELWFAEFGVNKEREHVIARAPLGKPTTKVWLAC